MSDKQVRRGCDKWSEGRSQGPPPHGETRQTRGPRAERRETPNSQGLLLRLNTSNKRERDLRLVRHVLCSNLRPIGLTPRWRIKYWRLRGGMPRVSTVPPMHLSCRLKLGLHKITLNQFNIAATASHDGCADRCGILDFLQLLCTIVGIWQLKVICVLRKSPRLRARIFLIAAGRACIHGSRPRSHLKSPYQRSCPDDWLLESTPGIVDLWGR